MFDLQLFILGLATLSIGGLVLWSVSAPHSGGFLRQLRAAGKGRAGQLLQPAPMCLYALVLMGLISFQHHRGDNAIEQPLAALSASR